MKTLKTLVILLACAGSIGAMDHAADATRVPLIDHAVCVTTVGGEVCFTPEQLMKLDFLYGMLEEEAPTERGKNIDLTAICAERPCLHYEGLHHIPTLVDCVTRADIDHYLSEISPEQACCAVLALHFLRASQNVFIWAHAYIINRLVNDNLFAVRCLSLSEARENLEHIIALRNNEPVLTSTGSLKNMLLKNGLSTSTTCVCSGATSFQLSSDGSRLAVERTIDGNKQVVLHRTSDGSEIGSPILGFNPRFNPNGSRLAVERKVDGNRHIILHRTSDGSEIGSPILGFNPRFNPNGSRLAVERKIDGNWHVVLYQTSDGSEIRRILGWQPVFSPDGSMLAVERGIYGNFYIVLHLTSDGSEIGNPMFGQRFVFSPTGSRLTITINDNPYVIALLQTSDGGEIRRILGNAPVFSPDGSRLAVSRWIDDEWHVVLYRTSDGSEIGNPILGGFPVFSPNGPILAVIRVIDGNCRVILHQTSDYSEIKHQPILGNATVFSPDGSLLKISFIIGGGNGHGLYFTDDGNALLQNVKDVQFGTNGTIVYQDGDRIACINPININSAEYVLVLAAIHLGHELIETEWRNIFDQALEQVKAFVREKTGKFIP